MTAVDISRVVAMQLTDGAGTVLATVGVRAPGGSASEAKRHTLNGGRALRAGDIEAFKLIDVDGVAVASGATERRTVSEGEFL